MGPPIATVKELAELPGSAKVQMLQRGVQWESLVPIINTLREDDTTQHLKILQIHQNSNVIVRLLSTSGQADTESDLVGTIDLQSLEKVQMCSR